MVALCAIALVGTVVAAASAAANGYLTRPLTQWLSTQLGRELRVDGGLRVYFGRVMRIRAARVRLASTPWAGRQDMLQAKDVAIDIDTISLLRDTVIVRQLVVVGLDLQLERNAEGLNNWTFNLHGSSRPGAVPLIIESAQLPGARIQFIGPRLQQPLQVNLDSLEQHALADGMLDLAASGEANGTSLDLRTHVGPLVNLIAGRDFRFRADGHLGAIALVIDGRIDSLSNPADTQIAIDLRAPDADYLTSHLGVRSLGDGPVALKVSISPSAPVPGVRADVVGRIGEFAVTARGSLLGREGGHDMTIDGNVSGPDLSRIGFFAGLKGLPNEPFRLQLGLQRGPKGLKIKEAELAIANGVLSASGTLPSSGGLAGSDLRFAAEIPDIDKVKEPWGLTKVLDGPVSATAHIRYVGPGDVQIQGDGTTNLGKLSLQGMLGATPDFFGTRLAFTLMGGDFAPLGRVLRLRNPTSGAYSATGNLEWRRNGVQVRNAQLKVAKETLRMDGLLGRRPLSSGTDVQLEIEGDSAARFASRFGFSGWPASKYRIAGRVQRVKGSFLLRDVNVAIAGASLQLDGALGDFPELVGTSISYKLRGTEIENFKDLFPVSGFPNGAFAASGRLSIVSNRLQFSKTEIQVADAQGTVAADIELPLTRSLMNFEIDAKIPDLSRLLPRVGGAEGLGRNLSINTAGKRSGRQWSVERLLLSTDNGAINSQGELILAPEFSARNVEFELRTLSLRKLGSLSGRDWPEQPLQLRARLTQGTDSLDLEDLAGRLGNTEFSGRLTANEQNKKPNYDVSLAFQRLDLDPYLSKPVTPPNPPSAPAASAGSTSDRIFVIPGDALKLPDLAAISGKLSLRAQVLRFQAREFRDVQVVATLRDGRLQVDPLAVTGNVGQLNARLEATTKGLGLAAHLTATAKDLRVSMLPLSLGDPNSSSYTAQVDLQGSGGSWRELAASLNGSVSVEGSGGSVPNSRLTGSSNGFIKQLIVSLDPMADKQPTTKITCTAFLLRARDGVVTTDPALVLRTAEVDIISNGSADLRSEKIDFSFKISARKGIGIGVVQMINPYLRVTGTLAKPGLTIDPTGALVNGGAAFATAGLSIVATTLWDRVVHEKDPCGAAVAEYQRRAKN